MNTNPKSTDAAPSDDVHLIVVEDEEVVIEHHPEDWIAFVLFWALAFIVFLQFFTRYVLNDSLAWTEEIARYGLMSLAFIGGAVVTRKKAHIAVELVSNLMEPGPLRAALLALVDFITLGFIGAAGLFLGDDRRAHAFQRMTVFDLPMSLVYGGVGLGCFMMLARQVQVVWRNARDGWRERARRHRANSRRLRAGPSDADPDFRFLCDLAGRHSRVHRAGVLVAALHPLHRRHSRLRDPAPDGRRARQLSAAGGAVLHPRRQPDELGRHHQPHLRFRGGDLRLDAAAASRTSTSSAR